MGNESGAALFFFKGMTAIVSRKYNNNNTDLGIHTDWPFLGCSRIMNAIGKSRRAHIKIEGRKSQLHMQYKILKP